MADSVVSGKKGAVILLLKRKKKYMFKLILLEMVEKDAVFYRKVGILLLKSGSSWEKRLGRIFLKKAIEKGDEKSYLIYHRCFSRRKKIIDDISYKEIYKDYLQEQNGKKKKILKDYLRLGTEQQKKAVKEGLQ